MEKPIKGFRIELKGVYREKGERRRWWKGAGLAGRRLGGGGGGGDTDKQEGSLQNPKCFVELAHTV